MTVIWRHLILLSFALLTAVASCNATSYLVAPWEMQLEGADFVGIVECEVAGPLVSKYRIIEVWKGDPKQKSALVCQLPASLGGIWPTDCGVRRLAIWSKSKTIRQLDLNEPEMSILSQRSKIPTDFTAGPHFNFFALESDKKNAAPSLSAEFNHLFGKGTLKDFRERSKKFLALPEENRAKERVLSSLQFTVNNLKESGELSSEESKRFSAIKETLSKIKRAKTLEQIIIALMADVDELTAADFRSALHNGGKPCIKSLEKLRSSAPEKGQAFIEYVLDEIEGESDSEEPKPKTVSAPTIEQLNEADRKWAKRFAEQTDVVSENPSLKLLTVYRPESIVNQLINFEHPKITHRIVKEVNSYTLIRYFGVTCITNRKHCLERLLEAKDPIIRTGAAVYLCSEDLDQGMKALEKCADQPDVAGTWAAITLACRGQKSAMPRALRVFDFKRGPHNPELHSLWDKQGQLKALLSNSAKASGVPQPTAPYDEWWKKYGDKVTLHDPWLAEMDRLKID